MSLTQLSRLLPLPEADLQQVLDYAATLSKQEAAEHFNDLLGETPQSIEFISSFNSRRRDPASKPSTQAEPATDLSAGVPKTSRAPKKKKAPLHTPAARQVQDNYAAPGTAYTKKSEDDYIVKRPTPPRAETPNTSTSTTKPVAIQAPIPRPPPSAAGSLISDFKTKSNSSSKNASRTSSPAPKTKVNISGGISMHGASGTLNEFDAAIRSLEISTNSSLLDKEKRKCNCIGARHPLLAAAPNCLNCGKVICVKEGLGPCTFCGQPLLTAVEVQSMIRELREERGREKMVLNNAGNRRAEVSKKPMPFSAARNGDAGLMSPAEAKAKEHRDKLLAFQAQNAKRTTVRDEAADFETPMMGVSNWASPSERAKQLKKQQKVLAEQEWNARPEYEKRRQVVSIDLVKGKIMKRMAAVERPQVESESEEEVEALPLSDTSGNKGGGTFSRNPLLGGLIKPVYDSGREMEKAGLPVEVRKKAWRRVQDDLDDNEAIILDGGVYGDTTDHIGEEPSCG